MSIELVQAELQLFANFTDNCLSFHSFVASDQSLLDAAASNAKYKCKTKSVHVPELADDN